MSTEGATTTVEATRLPGLEVTETAPEVRPEHWIERGPSKRLMLFAGRSNPALAQRISEELRIELGEVSLRSFASGETYCRFEESIRGADLFIVQTSSPPVDQHLMELLIMIDAAKLASARRITAVLPLYPYSRQDKKSRPREPITAKLVAEMIQAAGADRVLTMDLHAGQVQGFFQIPVDHMTALPMLAQYFRDLRLPEELVAVAPDTGRTRLASKFAEMIGGDLAVLQKDRPAHNVARVTNIIGDVRGKCAVMTDDMIDTAGTLVAGAEFLKRAGAKHVFACATHGIFSTPALERIAESPLDRVVVTDTVPVDPRADPDRIRVLPVAGILAQTIHNIFADDSVSAIFGDMNALF
jgi:ribose-phosphate pyrophosphokinase